MIGRQSLDTTPIDEKSTRNMAAKAPALATAAMKPVTGEGAPWYTSGVHMWNGTAATLKANPTSNRASPARSSPFESTTFLDRKSEIWVRLVEPVAPYVSAMPYTKMAEENPPRMKYLSAASPDDARR